MRKIVIFILMLTFCFLIGGCAKDKNTFLLEERYYEKTGFLELDSDSLASLIDNKESFAVFVYQPLCTTSSGFEKVLNEFFQNHQVNFYKIAFSNIKDTDLGKKVKYYPSFVIYEKGEVIDFLDANSDEDTDKFKNIEDFESWLTGYVELKGGKPTDYNQNNIDNENEELPLNEALLENVIKEENKVNIYFFWGSGCPHCKEEFAFLNNIENKYGDKYNLYTFETFENEDNAKILRRFASTMGDEIKGVPYTVIGSKSFSGFNDESKSHFIDAILSEYQTGYDVYFAKIKN